MKYLTLTNENITSMKKDEFNLIEAPTGNGKTTAVICDLGGYCETNNKTMLYLVPRKSLEEKLLFEYGNIDTITFHTYQYVGKRLEHNNFDDVYNYIIFDEVHTLLTNSTYDFSCYKLVNYINNTSNDKTTFLGMTATADPVYCLQDNKQLKKEINKLNVKTYDNSTKGKIYLVHNKENLLKAQKKAIDDGYKVINFTNDTLSLNDFKDAYNGYKCASLLSKLNRNALLYKSFENDEAYNSIIENEQMNVDHLTTTTILELGVSIKQTSNFLISFEGNYMPHTIEQAKSRIRASNNNMKVDMLFQIKNKYSSYLKVDSLSKQVNEFGRMYNKYGCFEEILKNNPADKEVGLGEEYERNKKDNYERFNPVAYVYLRYQLEFYEKQYSFQYSQEIFYIEMLQKMYPDKEIVVLESWNLYDLESLLESYLEGAEEVTLLPSDIEILKVELIELHLDKSHPYRKVGKNKLNDYLAQNYMPYIIENGKPYPNPETKKRESTWIIKRTAE